MTEYTIVEPGFEFIEPPTKSNYLEFLEKCTRTCYKSEDRIGPGTAEKLMAKVVKEYEHYSVTEHANVILKLTYPQDTDWAVLNRQASSYNRPGLRASRSYQGLDEKVVYVGGNLRAWMETLAASHHTLGGYPYGCIRHAEMSGIIARLQEKWPFFFEYQLVEDNLHDQGLEIVSIVDENPLTNTDNLPVHIQEKMMTLTCKIICDRSCSHQLVRHRLFAFSQESQRYCNYGKKGFQFIVPPSAGVIAHRKIFVDSAVKSYEEYLAALARKMPPEDARGLLPNCTKTEVVTTGTLGYWKHVFYHRANNPKAQWQIRKIMQGIQEKFRELVPDVFGAPTNNS